MEIRKATIDDIKDISRIHALSWKSAYKGIIPQTYLDELKEDFWVSAFETWLNDKVLTAQVMMENGSIIGCVAYGKAGINHCLVGVKLFPFICYPSILAKDMVISY